MSGTVQQAAPDDFDAQLRMSAVLTDFEECLARYRTLSRDTRRDFCRHAEYSYGHSPLERVRVFLPISEGTARPVHVFFHGGYWRAFDKEDYSFVARPIVEADAVAVIANYGLMPSVTMGQLIQQCRAVIQWLHANAIRLGANPHRITISGHSAGAHIATLLCLTRWADHGLPNDIVKSTVAVSGIYDLEPIFQSFLRAETRLTAADVQDFSPVVWLERGRRPATPLLLVVGAQETIEFQRQSTVFARRCTAHGIKVDCLRIENRHHMNIVLDLGSAETTLGRQLLACIRGT